MDRKKKDSKKRDITAGVAVECIKCKMMLSTRVIMCKDKRKENIYKGEVLFRCPKCSSLVDLEIVERRYNG